MQAKAIIAILLIFTFMGSASAATYYLDADGVGEDSVLGTADDVVSSDSNPGTAAAPWKTLPRAMTAWTGAGTKVTSGDTIKLRTGNYGQYFEVGSPAKYSHTDWITYEADTGAVPVFTKIKIQGYISGQPSSASYFDSFVRFRGIKLYHSRAYLRNVGYVQFYDCNFVGAGYTVFPYNREDYGIYFVEADNLTIDGCTIGGDGIGFDSYVGHFSDLNAERQERREGIEIGGIQGSEGGYGKGYGFGILCDGASTNVTINNCDIASTNIAISGVSGSAWTISNNKIHNTTSDSITIQGFNRAYQPYIGPLIISNNEIFNGMEIYLGSPVNGVDYNDHYAHNDGIQGNGGIDETFEISHVIIRNNKIYHQDGDAIFFRGAMRAPTINKDWLIENNLIYDCLLRYKLPERTINVTFYNSDSTVFRNNTVITGVVGGDSDRPSTLKMTFTAFYNNIIERTKFNFDPPNSRTIIQNANNNIVNNNSPGDVGVNLGPNSVRFNSYRDTNPDFTQFKALFNNYNNNDFTLAAGSMAINFGDPANAPATDILGNPRIGAPDAGAFEFQGTAQPCMQTQLTNYLSQWKAGTLQMATLMQKIAAWKAGQAC